MSTAARGSDPRSLSPRPAAPAGARRATSEKRCLTGAAREACERRLSQLGPRAPALPLIGDKRKAGELQAWEDYQNQMLAYKAASEMNPHPCPPQDSLTRGKGYLDKCALVNGALVIKIPFQVKVQPSAALRRRVGRTRCAHNRLPAPASAITQPIGRGVPSAKAPTSAEPRTPLP